MRNVLGLGLAFMAGLAAASHAGVPEDELAQAVKDNEHAAIQRLLAAKADPNLPLPDKSSVLAWAVYDRIALKRRGGPLPVAPSNYAGDALAVGGGLVLYLALAYLFHPYVIGVPVI